ncbi:OLC1v1005056C1 [Oldenlandia corymbosa var. corymbosa]|uniref:OLC1v1005056C1 n=1 Tax=Oldenlandia corymbosa var. corymbosa TaxID=529605 RepID=A0AAV1DEH7_OLDCO|nr:OLC1v1005056C1 [Oldenlandia corymbosa var. corymbosa]
MECSHIQLSSALDQQHRSNNHWYNLNKSSNRRHKSSKYNNYYGNRHSVSKCNNWQWETSHPTNTAVVMPPEETYVNGFQEHVDLSNEYGETSSSKEVDDEIDCRERCDAEP